MTTLPQGAIKEDQRLEKQASSASEELARHRWHWTLNADNPKRVPFREYARSVGKDHKTIQRYARGYETWVAGAGTCPSLNDAMERAAMSAEKAELVEAVAEANEVGLQQARKVYSNDVTRVREAVERRVEKDPDITPEEKSDYTRKVAKTMARSRQAADRNRENRQHNRTASLVLIDSKLIHARRDVEEAIAEARAVGLEEDAVEILEASIDKLQSATTLLRLAIAGAIDVDWDKELQRLGDAS